MSHYENRDYEPNPNEIREGLSDSGLWRDVEKRTYTHWNHDEFDNVQLFNRIAELDTRFHDSTYCNDELPSLAFYRQDWTIALQVYVPYTIEYARDVYGSLIEHYSDQVSISRFDSEQKEVSLVSESYLNTDEALDLVLSEIAKLDEEF